ncbi:MAG: (deoxy)nucleoside triphosphate pyrophosphohydrolase [Treponema sp.]|jgi:mutator protein MutT|nr:(deoxy)nucleoside triphosphate pyrophosphohydrolase [Treponema sp.]
MIRNSKKSRSSVAGIAVLDGRIFIAKRREGGSMGGKWEFPGGKVREGESDEEALKREFMEELGVAVKPGAFIAQAEFDHDDTHFTLRAYRIVFESTEFDLCVHTEWRWAAFDDLAKLDFAPSDTLLFAGLNREA